MDLKPWDPWRELEELRLKTNQLWDEFLEKLPHGTSDATRITFLPDVDLVELPDQYRLYLSVPGLIEEDIDLAVGEHSLVVRGERQPPYDPERGNCRMGEWRYGYFERRFDFSQRVRPRSIKATYEDGVLSIVVTKSV